VTEFSLSNYVAAEKLRVEPALECVVVRLEAEVDADVAAAIRHGVMSGGKRLRPILCATAYRASGGTADDAIYPLAISLELIHAYSLMHDDLPCMDDAELRRGRPTTHVDHGEDVTARAGAALIPAAALQALSSAKHLECGAAVAIELARELMEAAGSGGMVGGQWLDLEGEGEALGPEDLNGLYRRKTGALLVASLVLGARAARASDEVVEALRRYGSSIGLAFQIADDLLDATQSAETLGKRPSDAALDKSTYVGLYGLEEARNRAGAHVDKALEALRSVGIDVPALNSLTLYIVEREK
jgi:geranylgeranyl diphosphate synthase type II